MADPEESEMEQICNVRELSDELEGETAAVFMMATYGEGDPTDNAQEFFDWLKDGGVDLKGVFRCNIEKTAYYYANIHSNHSLLYTFRFSPLFALCVPLEAIPILISEV